MPSVNCGSLGLRPTRSSASQLLQIALVTLAALALSACGGNDPQNGTVNLEVSDSSECQVVKHPLGKTQICGQPQRVVALEDDILDLLLSLGVQPIGYAESRHVASDNFGEPLQQIKYLGKYLKRSPINVGTGQQPSLETILRLNPDLILGIYESSLHSKLSRIAPSLFPVQNWQAHVENYRWQQTLLVLGEIFKREQRAQQVIEEHQRRIARARADLEPISRDSSVLLLSMSGLDRIEVFTEKTHTGTLLTDLGFELVVPEGLQANYGQIQISLETLPQLNADRIIVMASGQSNVERIEKVWEQNPILRSLPAFQAGQVYFVDYQLWSRIRGPIATKLIIKQIRSLFLEPN